MALGVALDWSSGLLVLQAELEDARLQGPELASRVRVCLLFVNL